MASEATPSDHTPEPRGSGVAVQQIPWRRQRHLSRVLPEIERFLANSGFDRGPWAAVAFACGIAAWFNLDNIWQWSGLGAFCLAIAASGAVLFRRSGNFPFFRQALIVLPLLIGIGCATVWTKSELTGERAIDRPKVVWLTAKVLERQEQPAHERVRLVLATRKPDSDEPTRIRVNLPDNLDDPHVTVSAVVRLRARLMPPASPMLPGGYDFARTAWFKGLSATGTVIAPVQIITAGRETAGIRRLQARLSAHVRSKLDGSRGGIAATLASGDRGAIEKADAQAMRDAGLAHLLSISGLHVSAVIAATYLIAIRLLGLWPWLALRVRLPVVAAGAAALAGIGYTLLTGAQVPTVRSCVGAVLVLIAIAMGREALSLRMLAVAAGVVLLLWPESLMGPSFQMSFAAVMTLIALSTSATIRKFLAPREERWVVRMGRNVGMLFLTGLAIELALMPIGLYHFHRAGVYGAFANVIAIPLTTLVVMPLIALALMLDVVGAGAPVWWLADKAIGALIGLAHWVSSTPGAVTIMPAMGSANFALFLSGGVWLALWQSRIRYLGLLPATFGAVGLALLQPPDILVSGDGRHIGITGEATSELLVLRNTRSDFVRDNLTELAGMSGNMRLISAWDGAVCSPDFCAVELNRRGRDWNVLIARSHDHVPERALAAACDRSDIVIADRWLPRSCRPVWLKIDKRMLRQTGGVTIDLNRQRLRTVAQGQGQHGWWRGEMP